MNITRSILVTLLVAIMANVSQAAPGVSGSAITELFNYAAGPLDGQGGVPGSPSHLLLSVENWISSGDSATPGDPYAVLADNLEFGPQETLFPNVTQGLMGRSAQAGVGIASRDIGKPENDFFERNLTLSGRESLTSMRIEWNGGKAAFAVSDQDFDPDNFNMRLQSPGGSTHQGWGYTIEPDTDPNFGILKATAFRAFANGTTGNTVDGGAGIQLAKGDTYQVFVQAEVSGVVDDEFSVFVLSEADVANPETTVYLADLPATSQSSVTQAISSFNMIADLQFATYATQNFKLDEIKAGVLNGVDNSNFNDDAMRDPARQDLVAFRTPFQKLAWKSSLGDPYVAGDTRLDGTLLGQPTNSNVNANDINHLQEQIRLGNTSTVSYYDLDSSGVIDEADVEFLVETLYGSSMGDFDLEFDVDGDDLAAWAANYGGGGGWAEGDASGNGLIDGADFLTWQRNFTGPGPVAAAVSAVPEPTSLVLTLLAACASMTGVRLRRAV